MRKRTWTDEDNRKLIELRQQGVKVKELALIFNRTEGAIKDRILKFGLANETTSKYNSNFKAIYQDYDWCYERYINLGMTMQEMADECGASLRVIQKWCGEKHKLNEFTFKKEKRLNPLQREIIMAGTLGDGHITKDIKTPSYIESHALDEKDYVFWKYEQLKDCCASGPTYYNPRTKIFNGKEYNVQAWYRFETRGILELQQIKNMSKIDVINNMSELMLCLHLLDDGSRDGLWHICLANWSDEEKSTYIKICDNKFNLNLSLDKDSRYAHFNAVSSRAVDKMILNNLPNDLDIIHKKILDNDKIPSPQKTYRYVLTDHGRISLGEWIHINHKNYNLSKGIMVDMGILEIEEGVLLDKLGNIV